MALWADEEDRKRYALREAASRVVNAFERLGKTSNVIDSLKAHQECESSLIRLKETLATGAET